MDLEILKQVQNISFSVAKLQESISEHFLGFDQFSEKLKGIKDALEGIHSSFDTYQSSFTNEPWFQFLIGSLITLFATWVYEFFKKRREQKNHLYYLYRATTDQINVVLELRRTLKTFLDTKVAGLLNGIRTFPSTTYADLVIFLPLVALQPLSDNVNAQSTESGYIDTKIDVIYSRSKDLPFIVNDCREQLKYSIQRNQEMITLARNPASVQNAIFERQIKEFERVTKLELLDNNIPIYLKELIEAFVALEHRIKMGRLKWKIKFGVVWWKFYMKKDDYLKAKREMFSKTDAHFKPIVDKKLKEILIS